MYKEYTMNQLVLPLDLEVRLQENDIAFAVHDLVEQIPDEAFEPFWRTTGCPPTSSPMPGTGANRTTRTSSSAAGANL